ncbi:hypothetical protein DRH14_01760 [Candidatus Shapirobacteria bacterium]|nr:MAG: hypothetical protein DRH14_01760 [Candidatus Shapirobacteria bacterium]
MNIYFVRHGQSEGNKKKIYQGDGVCLSEKGVNQAKTVAKRLRNYDIDVIYSSPYLRAKQTAEIISEELNLPVEYWDKLKELKRPSVLEGLEYSHPKAGKIKKIMSENENIADWKYEDGESFNDLLTRAKAIKKHIFKQHKKQNVVCVLHVQILTMTVLSIILEDKISPDVFWQFYRHSRQKNTGITQVKYSQTFGWNLISWNDTTHL